MTTERDVDGLKEFNALVSQASKSSNRLGREPKPHRHLRDDLVSLNKTAEERINKKDKKVLENEQMWAVYGSHNFSACEKAVDVLPPGQYVVDASESLGIFFRKVDVNLDDLVDLPDSVSEEVIDEIETFWKREDHFREFGFLWKRGALLWGPPGSGKTSTVQTISKLIIDRGGISIYVDNPGFAAKGLAILRRVEPTRPLVIMIEDIDAVISEYGESDLLALMDGELQIDNVVFIATTNYPERLDKRFINRPSRFDIVKKIGFPTPEARKIYLMSKNKKFENRETRDELDHWVSLTDRFTIAHLKELIVSVEVFGVDLDTAIKRLRTMMDYSPTSSDNDGKVFGFK